VIESSLLLRLFALVLGPAGPTRGERTDERGREDEAVGSCSCDASAGNSVDGGIGEERKGGRGEASGGMEGRRRLLLVPFESFESRLDRRCTEILVGNWEREFALERHLDPELSLEPAGDRAGEYGGG